jgi:hypothetical protein
MAWCCGCQTGRAGDPSAAYAGHLAAIRDRLPPDLLATEESLSLHDTWLRELRLLLAEGTLSLGLDSYAGHERLTLTYTGAERFESALTRRSSWVVQPGTATWGTARWTRCRVGRSSTGCCSPPAPSWRWFPAGSGSSRPTTPNSTLHLTGGACRLHQVRSSLGSAGR